MATRPVYGNCGDWANLERSSVRTAPADAVPAGAAESKQLGGGAAAVFLDRDGVLNVRPPEHRYVSSPSDLRWLPRVDRALASLRAAGYTLIVVSNQRGLALGALSWETLEEIEQAMQG